MKKIHPVGRIAPAIGHGTRKLTRERAVELAADHGRPPHEVVKSEWEQAKREMNGDTERRLDDSDQYKIIEMDCADQPRDNQNNGDRPERLT